MSVGSCESFRTLIWEIREFLPRNPPASQILSAQQGEFETRPCDLFRRPGSSVYGGTAMTTGPGQIDQLLARAGRGDAAARQQLLQEHRDRLRRMVAVRLDRRLSARVDASDVVQDALAEAGRELDRYLRHPEIPFYPWLRRFAWDRLLKLHRFHAQARRSVEREAGACPPLPDESVRDLVDRIAGSGTSPSRRLIREELRAGVREALDAMAAPDREVLVLRYLEQLSFDEVSAVLGIGVGAVKMRHLRALARLRGLLEEGSEQWAQ
jgi:RNA polymerase sigma-70 factor (ECF subfamily)